MASNIKKNFSILLIWLIFSVIIISISAILVYFHVIDVNGKSIFLFGCGVLLFIILGFLSGNIKRKKGLMNGMLFSFIILIMFFLVYFLGLEGKISLDVLTKYLIYLLSGGLGGIFGVNFKPLVK